MNNCKGKLGFILLNVGKFNVQLALCFQTKAGGSNGQSGPLWADLTNFQLLSPLQSPAGVTQEPCN